MRRFLLAALAGLMVFGTALGAAATVDIDGGTLQAGIDDNLATQVNPLSVTAYPIHGGADSGEEDVTHVRIAGFDEATVAAEPGIYIRLAEEDGTFVGESHSKPVTDDEMFFELEDGLTIDDIERVDQIDVILEGQDFSQFD